MAGWGLGTWGGTSGGSWGLGFAANLEIVDARTVAMNIVRVTFNQQPLLSAGVGGALNPNTWELVRTTTNEILPVVAVKQVAPEKVDLLLLTRGVTDFNVTYQLDAPTLLDTLGSPATVTTASFLGLGANVPDRARVDRRETDIANPPFPQSGIPNTIQTLPGGDYAKETGRPLFTKLILRRMATRRGEFAHLPTYGLGLQPKELIRPFELPRIRREIQTELEREANVRTATANLTWRPDQGILSIQTRVFLTSGEVIDETVNVPINDALEF